MQFKGLLAGSISLNGYRPEQLRVGVQQYSRLGQLDNCRWCAVELDLFSQCGGEPIRTNNINRLSVLASQEIGLACPTLPILLGKYLRQWETHRQSDGGLDRLALLQTIQLLVTAPKSSLVDNLRTVYSLGLETTSIRDDVRFRDFYTEMPILPESAAGLWEMSLEKDCLELAPLMDGLVYQLDQQNDRAFYYLFQILRLRDQKQRCGQRFRGWRPNPDHFSLEKPFGGRFQPEYAIWQHLFQRADSQGAHPNLTACLEVLFDWYNNRSEAWLYLTQALLSVLRDYSWETLPEETEFTLDQVEVIYQLNQTSKIELDPTPPTQPTQDPNQPTQPYHEICLAYQATTMGQSKNQKTGHPTKGKTRTRTKKASKALTELLDDQLELVEDPIPHH